MLENWRHPRDVPRPSCRHTVLIGEVSHVWTERDNKGRVFIAFPYNAELDMFEIQLQSLHQFVDYFVMVESQRSYSGLSKSADFAALPLLLRTRFARFAESIILVPQNSNTTATGFDFESYQLQRMWNHYRDFYLQSGDIFIITHADAIVMPETVEVLKHCWPPSRPITQDERAKGFTTEARWRHIRIPHLEAYYSYEYLSSNQGIGPSRTTATVINSDLQLDLDMFDLMIGGCAPQVNSHNATSCNVDHLRQERFTELNLTNHGLPYTTDRFAAWHCSWCMPSIVDFRNKLATTPHIEINANITEDEQIIALVQQGLSPYLPPYRQKFKIHNPFESVNSAPQYVLSENEANGRFAYLLRRRELKRAGFRRVSD